ncbi:glutathione S-transferase [Polaromonas sp. CF318]|uniref:glutathione S-transferase family protein n=1 Tax=Polaromonas sp. CF318 TaxID=1144318 RepID=UPI000271176A|nr:glutathione S-transferase family protein [Polaromonas sp. CF318]EJL87571.1 glutathione S-transferase [Polaromonas sp. CF318]
MKLTLISHALCPYVQRAAIVLAEKGVAFERRDVDLANKPDWFKAVSPLGKTPVLLVDGDAIFESAVICEYLDDTLLPRLHPGDALQRAQHRAWMEFGSALLNAIGAFYNAADAASLARHRDDIRRRFTQLEAVLVHEGPYFAGASFGMVDAVFGPVFRYFDVLDGVGEDGFLEQLPKVQAWRTALATRPSVRQAVGGGYARDLQRFFLARGSELSRRIAERDS